MQNLNSDQLRKLLAKHTRKMNWLAEQNDLIVGLLAGRGLQAVSTPVIDAKKDDVLCKTTFESLRKLGEQLVSSGLVSVKVSSIEEKALTADELIAAEWWCRELSIDCAEAMISLGFSVDHPSGWDQNFPYECCFSLGFSDRVCRDSSPPSSSKQIHRIGNNFYWGAP